METKFVTTNTIYSINNCHYCDNLKRELDKSEVEYIEKKFDLDNLSQEDRKFLVDNGINKFPTFIHEVKKIIVNPTAEEVKNHICNY